jgi:rsbT co-antagonist protein RsbR
MAKSRIPDILKRHEADLLGEWIEEQKTNVRQKNLIKDSELREQSARFLNLLQKASAGQNIEKFDGQEWNELRELLVELSKSRSLVGFSPSETASFVFSLKKPLFHRMQKELGQDASSLADENWRATELLDKLGLFTIV